MFLFDRGRARSTVQNRCSMVKAGELFRCQRIASNRINVLNDYNSRFIRRTVCIKINIVVSLFVRVAYNENY